MPTSSPAHSDAPLSQEDIDGAPDYSHAPLIEHLRITGFQSLHDIDLPLEPFTVIVGPSSSGKSALVRALRTLTNNARGTAYITTNFKKTTIRADITDHHGPKGSVTLTRGTGTKAEDNAYVLTPPDTSPSVANAPEAVFTKLSGEVPPEVAEFIGLPGDPSLTFAGQFDKPYLLDSSPQEVARALASLTNVHVIFEASRAANRERLAHSATLRTRTTDLETIRLRTEEFRTLAAQRDAQDRAEDALNAARQVTTRLEGIRSAIDRLDDAHEALHLYGALSQQQIPDLNAVDQYAHDIPRLRAAMKLHWQATETLETFRAHAQATIPTLDAVEAAQARLKAYQNILVRLRTTASLLKDAQAEREMATEDWGNAQDAYIGGLTALGACPTCGQSTDHIDLEKIHV